ncbi:CWF19-like protein 2 [Lasioglossum baleicum]|uniref:CWF19-like protein 2 n=1 Tax=Lasioglossum baleicum TaxID=434251 RepID=UPI003FCE73F9
MKHKKEKCKSKYENDKSRKKDKKKRKKHDTSNSSDDDSAVEQEWVEKSVIQTDLTNQNVPTSTRKEESCKREDWMTVNSIFPCVFNDKKPSSVSSDKQKCDLDKLGQSDKELNPYWKEGGNGLPSVDSVSTNRDQSMDANWLKKSLKRAQEEAEREGKSLEEIAAQRWGSLEVIQSMISKAEKMCSRGNYKKQYDRRDDHVKKSERYKTSGECLNYSANSKSDYHRSRRYRSRSRSSDRNEQHSMRNNAQYEKRKQTYKRPVDCTDDDYSVSTSYNAHCSTTKRWQKATVSDKIKDTRSNASELKTISVESNSNVNNISGNKEINTVPELDLNKLGAKIVKAEIMGDTKLVAELKIQLKEARKLATNAIRLNESEKDQTVILTRTDMKGVTRPLEHRNQSTDSSRNTKRKTAQTHTAGKRTLHYFDDDKYSLQELFQREKGRSANEDDAAFTKVASRTMNMDEIFEEQITRVQESSKRDEKDRSLAIKEHKRLSKSLDTCHWCIDSKYMLKHMIVAMDSEICLSLPAYTSLTEGHCMITPVQHIACQLQLDENIWEKLKAYKQALYNMFAEQNKYPVFYEIYKNRHKFAHMQLECVPLPKEIGELIPMYFKKALLECETEWSMNKKIIDLEHKDIKQAVPNGLSYFMVEFEIGKGYAHIIEDEHLFPKNFAEEIIGGMLDLDHDVWRKPRKETFDKQREKVLKFSEIWKNYDCTIT